MRLVFGEEFVAAATAFRILILTVMFVFSGGILSNYILAYNRPKQLAGYVGISALINVVLNASLIPLFGIIGSAIATASSQLFHKGFVWRIAKQANNFRTIRHLGKIAAAASVMAACTFWLTTLGVPVWLNIPASALVYFGILYALKERVLFEIRGVLPFRK